MSPASPQKCPFLALLERGGEMDGGVDCELPGAANREGGGDAARWAHHAEGLRYRKVKPEGEPEVKQVKSKGEKRAKKHDAIETAKRQLQGAIGEVILPALWEQLGALLGEVNDRRIHARALGIVCDRHPGLLSEVEVEVERVKIAIERGEEYPPPVKPEVKEPEVKQSKLERKLEDDS